ncbi:hypothetical protein HG536_0B02770 [Torulaspora globosa]|uniref:Mitochondrial outer membrane protein OM45 n=1 Tax=Torulaspora globosa TaxID=48254 RepID=A0A7G3ZD28_9SACH|nr:uncharacterized protein HG536_0B02770 [Torulaspora globosa]QLL31414.1 hypothetical protein HG536_0B02770 [Torulaspora globosa]
MSSRLIIGGAAAAAAAYVIYEYQQQNERQKQALHPAGSVRPTTTLQEQPQVVRDLQQTRDDSAKWLKDRKELGQVKATEMTNDLQRNLADELSRQRRNANEIVEDTSQELSKGWNRIKEGVSEDSQSFKEALLGVAQKPQSRDSAVGAAKQKGHEIAEGAKDKTKSIFNYGFNEAERAKAIAIGEYDKANKEYNTLLERFNESKKGLFDAGDSVLKEQLDDYKKIVQEKKRELQRASDEYARYAKDNFNEISDKLDEQDEKIRKEGGFFRWLKGGSAPGDEKSIDIDRVANSKSLAGFGENAQFFSEEEIEDQLRNKQIGPSEAQQRLNELKKFKQEGWFKPHKSPETEEQVDQRVAQGLAGWGESAARFAQDELDETKRALHNTTTRSREEASKAVDDAWNKLQEAKKTVQSTGSKWWNASKDKTNEAADEAQKAYNEAVKNYESAKKTLDQWSDETSAKFWSSADDAVRVSQNVASKAQSAANKARAKTQKKVGDSDEIEQQQLLEE